MDVAAEEKDEDNKDVIYDEGSQYVTVFDPLDGSSNVDAGIPTGKTCAASLIVPHNACDKYMFCLSVLMCV